jgi:predicted nucleotidyltransferase
MQGLKAKGQSMHFSDLSFDRERLAALCRRFGVVRLEVMGSFARGDAGPDSDLDILVTLAPGGAPGLEFISLKEELEELFGKRVDLLTRAAVESSPNKYFRHYALRDVQPLHACD